MKDEPAERSDNVFASAAWVHRFSGNALTVNGSLVDIGCTATPTPFCNVPASAMALPTDWFEGKAGISGSSTTPRSSA